MKERTKSIFKAFAPVKLYLDDIEKIANWVMELPDTAGVKIETDDYEIESMDELKALGQERTTRLIVNQVLCTGIGLSFWVSVAPNDVSIGCYNLTAAAEGVFHRIELLLRSRQRLFSFHRGGPYALGGLIAIILSLLINSGVSLPVWLAIQNVLTIISVGLTLYLFMTVVYGRSVVYLTSRQAHPNFWGRNSDKIIVEVIKGVSAAIAGALITLAIQGLLRKP